MSSFDILRDRLELDSIRLLHGQPRPVGVQEPLDIELGDQEARRTGVKLGKEVLTCLMERTTLPEVSFLFSDHNESHDMLDGFLSAFGASGLHTLISVVSLLAHDCHVDVQEVMTADEMNETEREQNLALRLPAVRIGFVYSGTTSEIA